MIYLYVIYLTAFYLYVIYLTAIYLSRKKSLTNFAQAFIFKQFCTKSQTSWKYLDLKKNFINSCLLFAFEFYWWNLQLYNTSLQALRAWILEFEMSVHRICEIDPFWTKKIFLQKDTQTDRRKPHRRCCSNSSLDLYVFSLLQVRIFHIPQRHVLLTFW